MGMEDIKFLQRFINFGEKKAGSTNMGIAVGLFAAFAGVLFGYDTGTISGVLAMQHVKDTFPSTPGSFSSSELLLIISILSVGTFFGALGAPVFADRIGRRWSLIIGAFIVFQVGVILQVIATKIPLLCAGRAIAGLGVGIISASVVTYQSETTPKFIRGAVVSCYQLAITIGLLLAAIFNNATHNLSSSASYRIPLAIQFVFSLILSIGMFLLPESPRFFVSKERGDDAIKSLCRLRKLPADHPDLIEEYDEIKASYDLEKSIGKVSWKNVFTTKNKQLRRLTMGVLIQFLQQLTGINFIFYFGTTFFQRSGISNAFTISMITNIVNVVFTLPGVCLVEVVGRRKLLLTGSTVMALSQLIVAIVGTVASPDSDAPNKVLVAFVCVFIAGFAATWGPLAWAIVGETFALGVRQKSISICTAANWLCNWAIAYATPYMVDPGPGNANLGAKVFFIWGGCNVIGALFVYFMVYESKGMSLEEVNTMWCEVDYAWQSTKYIPHRIVEDDSAYSYLEENKNMGIAHVEQV